MRIYASAWCVQVRAGSVEEQEALDKEQAGMLSIRHHVSRSEMDVRTSLARESRDSEVRNSTSFRERRTGHSLELAAHGSHV